MDSWRRIPKSQVSQIGQVQYADFTLGHQFRFIFFIVNYLQYFFIKFKDQGLIFNLLVMRIQKLSLNIEIDKEIGKA